MSEAKPFIDPREVVTLAIGFALGLGILVFFLLLAKTMGLTTIVDIGNLPRQ